MGQEGSIQSVSHPALNDSNGLEEHRISVVIVGCQYMVITGHSLALSMESKTHERHADAVLFLRGVQ